MKFSKVEISVGFFMLLGILACIIMALKVSGLVLNSSSDTYTLYAKFDNIGSLKLRAPVKIGGVLIGRVDKITLDPKTLSPVVAMSINSQYDNLSSESKASILTSGIIGEQYIGITPGFYDEQMGSEILKNGDYFTETGSALVLEDLIGKLVYSLSGSKEDK